MNVEERKELLDLNRKSKQELLELLKRQEKLLNNKILLNNLKDKGARIRALAEKLKILIEEKERHEKATAAAFHISEGMPLKNNPLQPKYPLLTEDLDSDDDLIALEENDTTTQSVEETLSRLTIEDTKESAEKSKVHERYNEQNVDSYVSHIAQKVEKETNVKPKFKPFSTLKNSLLSGHRSSTSASSSENLESLPLSPQSDLKRIQKWGESAVSPPPISGRPVNTLSLQESLRLLSEQSKREKELAIQRAVEKLSERTSLAFGYFPNEVQFDMQYREVQDDDSCEGD